MRITPVDLGDLDLTASDLVRSPGLHASDIYGDLYQDLEPTRFVRGSPPDFVRMMLGMAFERQMEYLFFRAGIPVDRPGEFRSPGGWALSPDLVFFLTQRTVIGELKLTWMSSKDMPRKAGGCFPTKFDKYMTQIRDGCHAIETPYARLYACFVNGAGYVKGVNKPPAPELLAWDIEFSPQELRENFDKMLNHARHKRMLP